MMFLGKRSVDHNVDDYETKLWLYESKMEQKYHCISVI